MSTGLGIGWAVQQLRAGSAISRGDSPVRYELDATGAILGRGQNGGSFVWYPSQADVLATDWRIA